ncbi:MAG TPA: hypothetical protein VG297_09250, partial [Bryobacteraceae bacterium]|nr:hypothetical protein [Bryobacteraceae bacterium]
MASNSLRLQEVSGGGANRHANNKSALEKEKHETDEVLHPVYAISHQKRLSFLLTRSRRAKKQRLLRNESGSFQAIREFPGGRLIGFFSQHLSTGAFGPLNGRTGRRIEGSFACGALLFAGFVGFLLFLLKGEVALAYFLRGFPAGVAFAVVAVGSAVFADGLGVLKGAFEGAFGGDFVALGEMEAAEVFFAQVFGVVAGGFIDARFDGVAGALPAPEKPVA